MTITSTPCNVRQPFATRRSGCTLLAIAPFVLALSGAPALAQTPRAAPHAPHTATQRATAPNAASASLASSGTSASGRAAGAGELPALPRLTAITPPENDGATVRFALYAARDIELLGLQFPAKTEGSPPDADVVITMHLRDSAAARMRDFSRAHMNEQMTLIVDGVEMVTAMIGSELGGRFQLQMPKEKARLLFQRVLAKAGPAT
jgi:preprotein translocase subunit SecD